MGILVTGIAGFIGFHTAQYLLKEGRKVIGIDNINDYYDPRLKYSRLEELGVRTNPESFKLEFISSNPDLVFYKGSISDKDLLVKIASENQIDSVIHLAAQAGVRYSIDNPEVYIDSNITGFFNILELCRHEGIKTLTYASSSSVYGNDSRQPFSEDQPCDKPISLYAATKRSNELMAYTYAHLYGINMIGLRFFTVYGPWGRPDMAPMLFAKAAFEGKPIKVFNNGNQSRDFTYVDDIVNGLIKAHQVNLESDGQGDFSVMNIGNGSPVQLMDFIECIEEATGHKLERVFLEAQPGDVAITYANTQKLNATTKYKPKKSIREGIEEFVAWYRHFYNLKSEV